MRILMTTPYFPWPADAGSKIRVLGILESLAKLGDVDLFVLWPSHRDPIVPSDSPAARVFVGTKPDSGYTGLKRVNWAIRGREPIEIFGRDYSALRADFQAWAEPPYDLIWCNRAESYAALAPCLQGPKIVDIDDLEDRKILGALRLAKDQDGKLRPRTLLSERRRRRNARLWRSIQLRIADSVDAVVVASELDKSRLGVANTVVIPNGYPHPDVPAGRKTPGDPPTVLLQGLLSYPPNADAGTFLVRDVLPQLRKRVGEVRVRLVGRAASQIKQLQDPPEVTVTGWVEEMSRELAQADVVIVPLRLGSGTRIKILEAFANRVPVVSTSLGAEGLDVEDGRHLLIADSAESLAEACASLLECRVLRERLIDEAEQLFDRQYRWDRVGERITGLVAGIVDSRFASGHREGPRHE